MFSPTLGRFVTKDPIGFQAGDVNLYRYVGNDPVNETDPTGLFVFTAIDKKFFRDPKSLTWDDYETVIQLPKGANPRTRAFTGASTQFTTSEPVVSVFKLPLSCTYVARATVNSIDIRSRFEYKSSWFFDDPLNKLDPAFKNGPLLAHEQYHYALTIKFLKLATKRWNDLFAKSGVSATGSGNTPEYAIQAARTNLRNKIQGNIDKIHDQLQILQKDYDGIAHITDPVTGIGTITKGSQESAEKRVNATIDFRLNDAFKNFYNQK